MGLKKYIGFKIECDHENCHSFIDTRNEAYNLDRALDYLNKIGWRIFSFAEKEYSFICPVCFLRINEFNNTNCEGVKTFQKEIRESYNKYLTK